MPTKAKPEQMPAMIAELANRSANVKHMKTLQKFISVVRIEGSDAIELGQAINWLNNVVVGEDARCAELKAQLPDQNTEIKLGEAPAEAPQDPEPPAAPAAPAVSQGGVEMSKGSEVLQPA